MFKSFERISKEYAPISSSQENTVKGKQCRWCTFVCHHIHAHARLSTGWGTAFACVEERLCLAAQKSKIGLKRFQITLLGSKRT